jgi:hypothetical protein
MLYSGYFHPLFLIRKASSKLIKAIGILKLKEEII